MKLEDIIKRKIDNIISNRTDDWGGSIYENIKRMLELDERGDLGEHLIAESMKHRNHNVIYKRGLTGENIDYDIIIDDVRIEIKTATITISKGKRTNFQHENILREQRTYDALLFIDITPDTIYLTAVNKPDVLWNKCHSRKYDNYYKIDFTEKQILNNNISKFKNYKTGKVKTTEDIERICEFILKSK